MSAIVQREHYRRQVIQSGSCYIRCCRDFAVFTFKPRLRPSVFRAAVPAVSKAQEGAATASRHSLRLARCSSQRARGARGALIIQRAAARRGVEPDRCPGPTLDPRARVRVTPALAALSTTFWRTSPLIRADLPTFGNPASEARTGRGSKCATARRRIEAARPARTAASCSCFTPVRPPPGIAPPRGSRLAAQPQRSQARPGRFVDHVAAVGSPAAAVCPCIQRCRRGVAGGRGTAGPSRTSDHQVHLASFACEAGAPPWAIWPGYH